MPTRLSSPIEADRYFGRSVKRREDPRLITGHGRYTADYAVPNALHVAILRSPHSHARLARVDAARARARPGVVAVYTGADLKDRLASLPCNWILPGMHVPTHPALAYEKVRYVGDRVAVAVADDPARARDALDLIEVDYEPLAAVTNQELARRSSAPSVHDDVPSNTAVVWSVGGGDFAKAVAEADVHLRQRFTNQRLIPTAIEPRAVLARYERATNELTVHTSSQAPHLIRRFLAETLHFPEHQLRVVASDVGGGFGSKLHFYPEELLCAFLAWEIGRPVRWVESRSENYLATTHGRDHIQDVEVAARRDGTITGLKVTSYANLGAYLSTMGPGIPTVNFGLMLSGCYAIPVVQGTIYGVLTNTTPVDTYRGAGRPEATYLVERVIDLVARALNLDPAEVRRRNFIPTERFPFTTVTGMAYDSGDYQRSLDAALERAGYDALRERQRKLRRQGRYVGIGLCSYVEFCGLGSSRLLGGVGLGRGGWESATVRVHPSGKVTLYSGSSDQGQGHATSFAQIAADGLGLPLEDVAVIESDTATVQFGNATYNSRTMPVGGTAVKLAVDKVVAKARKIAAHLLEAAEEDVQFQGDHFSVRSAPHRVKTFPEVALAANLAHNYPADLEPGLEAQSFYDPVSLTSSFGTHLAVVEVDVDTGQVRVERYVAVDDCGNVINPLLAAGQVHGGIAQGLGQALLEGAEYDEQGQLLTGSLADYALPRATDLPSLEVSHTVTPSPVNPLGVKGIGEAGTIGATPAIVNAVVDALAPFGVVHLDMPLKPERIWKAIHQAERRQSPS
jgi:aerobic carbon-monoxide dehydrogenase large subunit